MGYFLKNRQVPTGSTGVGLPVGNSQIRPTEPVNGIIRFNTDGGGYVEYYNEASGWINITQQGGYSNANVVSFLESGNSLYINITGNISTTGNVKANYFIGDGGLLTNVLGTYGNANVANFLGNLGNVNISTQGNITANYYFGNGSQLTGLGKANTGNITFNTNVISTDIANGNVVLTGNGVGVVVISAVGNNGGTVGLQIGTPQLGNLVGAVNLTPQSSVTNSIAELNQILGLLVPVAPPNFPGNTTLTIANVASYRMANGVAQNDNTQTGNKSVAGGTTVSSLRNSTYATSQILTVGPGNSGVLTAYLNSADVGNVTFFANTTPTANGVHGNLIVFNNQDYHASNANIIAGFYDVFSTYATGSVPQGWNEIYLADTITGNTATPVWYYDNSNPGAPQFSNTTITQQAAPSYIYSSTIPHYIGGTTFSLTGNVNRLSGNMYPTGDTFLTGSGAGAFGTPIALTYASANIPTPVQQNLYANSGNLIFSTTTAINNGFGSSNAGPSLTVVNGYASTTATFNPGKIILYKTGNSTAVDEGNISVANSVGSGAGTGFRIANPGTGNTPVYTGTEAAFNSVTGPLYTYDAIVVGSGSQGVLTFSQNNFSTGYLPTGPNLSTQGAGQWFTFKFVRTSVSKFNINITGTVGGVWVALPGSALDSVAGGKGPTSGLNGWLNMHLPYGGAGIPGSNTAAGGNGSNGCSLGGVVPINTAISGSYTCTFGTLNSSTTATNEIYVRIYLTTGQSVTALSISQATN
jgi:hypothetical protein